jgi:hypothetical protein
MRGYLLFTSGQSYDLRSLKIDGNMKRSLVLLRSGKHSIYYNVEIGSKPNM